ncbi:hypothetical protein JCGZ_17871 [Jatropha curcas]|uniref:Uncharacterized protein n=1 Tax=Jatropha curcas TaxID=180498 RepID=A0A067JVB0_JATCU|nr:hypothetical protein JCGZ_17871 [Jatropha curcas]
MGTKGSFFRYADWIDKFLMLFGILGSIGDGLLTPLTMYTLSGLINEYATSESGTGISLSIEVVDKYSLRLLYVAIFVGISAFLEGTCWTRTAERQTSQMRMEYLKSILRQEVGFFDKQATSHSTFQVISAISTDAHSIQDTIAEKIPNCLAHLSSFIFSFVVSFTLSWRLALATMPFTIMFIIPGVVFGKLLMHAGIMAKEAYAIAGGIAEQAISSIRTVYSYVGEHQILDKFGNALEKSMKLGIKQGFTKGLLIGSMGMIFAAWAFLAWVGSVLVTEGGEKGGAVFVSGTCVILGGVSIMSALPNLSFISEATIAATRIQEMIDQIPPIDSEYEKGKMLQSLRGEIEFRKVDFSYPSRPDTPILQGFNLKVQAGKTVGLVGGSGSGKSTIISLLERFYDPTRGDILLDGYKIKKLELQWLRSQMGLVNQEPVLFATSIKENILFGKEGASNELVVKAAKAANAHEFILKLPDGYETQVGQFGVQLSGGQKQRIAIARALIRDPKILLLDEATSALDAESERIVQEALDNASVGRTTIIVAHRLSTIRGAHLIVVLQSGRVIESGSHNELMQMKNREGSFFRYADWIDKFLMLFGILGSIGDGLLTPLTMYTLSGLINEYATSESGTGISLSIEVVDKYSLRLLYVAIFVGISAFLEGTCWTRTAERQTSQMRMEYLKSILRQEVGFFDKQATSHSTFQVISAISTDAHSIQDTIAEKIPNCLAHLSSFIFSFVVSFTLSWRLALATMPFTIMFIIPGVVFGKLLMHAGIMAKEAYAIAGGIAEQAISSIRTVYSYVGEHQILDKFGNALEKSMKLGIKQGFTKGLLIGSMGMIFAAWAFLAWVGSVLVTEGGEKGGAVFVSGTCVILGGVSIMSALPNLSFISEATIAATRIQEMIDQIPPIDSEYEKGKMLQSLRGEIEFRKVDFSYPSRPDTPILQGFNLKVQAGKTVGLVGGSGSGKSTIISLLERFYDPTRGDILLDGYKIKKLELQWLRSQMGLVNQEPVLFATSIKENILFGKEGASNELVVKAAKAANAHEFILKLPDGYETQVGQFGVQLSGGQKQRIAIARALIRDPKILLLDEATSALDAESERIVQEALDNASVGRTTIIVAHRLSTIRGAHLIVVLQSGRVIESGSHNELMQMKNREGGAYSKMVQLQQSTAQEETTYSPSHSTQQTSHRTQSALHTSPVYAFSPALSYSSNYSIQQTQSPIHNSPAYAFSPVFSVTMTHSFLMDSYDQNEGNKLNKTFHSPPSQWRLLRMNAPEWKRAFLGCLGAAGFGAVQSGHAYCLGSIVSVYFLDNNSEIKSESRTYCFIFLGLAVASFFTNLLQHYNFAIMGERLTKRVREKMLGKVFTFEVGWFDEEENTSAAICARLASQAQLVRSLIADRMSLLVQVFFSASIAFVLALIISWRVAIVMIAIQPLIVGSFYSRSVLMKSMSTKAEEAQNEGSQVATEAVINHRTITAFSSQKRILEFFRQAMKGPKKETVKQSWLSGFGLFSSQFFTTASVALTFWYGGRLMAEGKISSKRLFQVFFILMSTGKNIADAGSMSSDLAKGSNAIRSVFAILDRKSEINPDNPNGIKVKRSIKGNIELKNIIFSYPARPNHMIFNDLSLKIEAGQTMALVGHSGSGKSTIIGLIERFYDPKSGSILIDDHDVKSYNLRNLRSHIALVSQEPTLFAGTICQNIIYGRENATEAEIREAAMLANAHEFISSMKDGYETYCGERGVQLSGGQKQRIALARAILKKPKVLLLDEATSALDSVSENLVQEALEKMMAGRTCVVVAHRLSTIQKADTIAVVKNGKVVEKGSHSALLAIGRHGCYYSLVRLQAATHTSV